jgi:carbon storage regulator
MLVLSRKPSEAITIGDKITVRVLAVFGNQVKLGIEAPKNVTILREELERREMGVKP